MKRITARAAVVLFAFLCALLGPALPGSALPGSALAAPTADRAVQQPACGDTSGFTEVALSDLPPQAGDTVELILAGGPYPYPQDGTVFANREGILPACASGYYHEYTVPTPGSDTRGARRIVTGSAGEYFYTADHYASFALVDLNS